MGGIGELWNVFIIFLVDLLVGLHGFLSGIGLGDLSFLSAVGLSPDLSWGLAIIIFTLAIKVVTFPLTVKQIESSKAMQDIQPQMRELQKKHGKDRERLMQEQMRLYKEYKINPAMGCLPMLIQMPVWIGLYQALFHLAQTSGVNSFSGGFLWLSSLAVPEPFPQILALLTGVSQWVVQRMMTPTSSDPQQKAMNNAMQFMPIMFVFFAFSVPSGLVLYWVNSNIFSIVQQYFIMGWGSLFPLPFIGGPARASSEVARISPPSSNGSRPEADLGREAEETGRPSRAAADGSERLNRGPGGGRKKRSRRS